MGYMFWIIGGLAVTAGIVVFYNMGKRTDTKMSENTSKKITFDEFIELSSDMADDFMNTEKEKNNVQCFGGDCIIYVSDETPDKVTVKLKIYGKDSFGKWKESSITYNRMVADFSNDSETQKQLQEIRSEPLKMKVTLPEKEVNKK